MEDTVKAAGPTPKTLEEVIAGLRGFGIEENMEIVTFRSPDGKEVQLRLVNLPVDAEVKSIIACEELKGYAWVQNLRVEILSRSICWIDGHDILALTPEQRLVKDPTDGNKKDIQIALRNIMRDSWGREITSILWKILMVHSDKIEKRLQGEFPDSMIMTDVERRFTESVMREIEASNNVVIADTIEKVFADNEPQEEKKA